MQQFIDAISLVDMSAVNVFFVASVPGGYFKNFIFRVASNKINFRLSEAFRKMMNPNAFVHKKKYRTNPAFVV